MSEDPKNYGKYPVKKHQYYQATGRLLPHRISQVLGESGYRIKVTQGQSNGVDLIVYNLEGNPWIVMEILNWCKHSGLAERRLRSIEENLNAYRCHRLVVYTHFKNEEALDDLPGITALKIGYQILPKFFYDFFSDRQQVDFRCIDSKETTEHLRSIITNYLSSIKAR